MKIPKTKNRYCKHCKKHTEHTVSQTKTAGRSKAHPLSRGNIKTRAKQRGRSTGFGNLGKWGSKPAISKFKRGGAKSSKKTDLRFKCKECKKSSVQRKGTRAKKVEIK